MSYPIATWQPLGSVRRHGPIVATLVLGLAGTGGSISRDQILMQYRTGSTTHATLGAMALAPARGHAFELNLIRKTLRLGVAETAQLFGVSRPTIYSWQNGKSINPENAARLREIVQALEPHLEAIETQVGRVAHRAIEGRSNLLQQLAQGAAAHDAIGHLAEILSREASQRERLARRLRGRSSDRGAADLDTLG